MNMQIRYTDDPARVVTKRERPQDKKLTYFVERKYINDKGQKRQKLFKVKDGKRAAEVLAAKTNEARKDRVLPEYGPVPCHLVFQQFVEKKEHEVAFSTHDNYQDIIKNRLNPFIGDEDFRTLDKDLVSKLITQLFKLSFAADTVTKAIVMLCVICEDHMERNQTNSLLPINPARNGKRRVLAIRANFKEGGVKTVDAFTRDEASQILAIAKKFEPVAFPVILAAFNTGMRRGELLGLRWEDIGATTISVSRSAGKKGRIKPPKNNKSRKVAISPALKELFKELRRTRKNREGLRDPEYVFTTVQGCRWDPANFSKAWLRVRRRAVDQADEDMPVRPLSYHCTRHSFATWALNANKPIIWVQHQMGHGKPSTTLDIYGHFIPSETEDLDFLSLDVPEIGKNRASGGLRVI